MNKTTAKTEAAAKTNTSLVIVLMKNGERRQHEITFGNEAKAWSKAMHTVGDSYQADGRNIDSIVVITHTCWGTNEVNQYTGSEPREILDI